jgi:hypothetical protein
MLGTVATSILFLTTATLAAPVSNFATSGPHLEARLGRQGFNYLGYNPNVPLNAIGAGACGQCLMQHIADWTHQGFSVPLLSRRSCSSLNGEHDICWP